MMQTPTQQPPRRWPMGALVGAALSLAAACATHHPDYRSLGLVQVTGAVKLDGRPLAGAYVVFEHPDQTFSHGKTDSQGKYRLMFNTQQPGALPGPKTVRISMREPSEEESELEGEAEHFAPALTIPACYNSASHLSVWVQHRASLSL